MTIVFQNYQSMNRFRCVKSTSIINLYVQKISITSVTFDLLCNSQTDTIVTQIMTFSRSIIQIRVQRNILMNNSSLPLIVQVDTVNSRGSLVAVATGTARTVPEDNAEDSAEWRTGLSVRVRRRRSVDHNRVRPGHGHTVTYYFPGKVTGRGEGSATPASEEMRK